MQATSTRSLPNPRAAATAILLAGIFAVGAALGAVAGINLAVKPAPAAIVQAVRHDTAPLSWHRFGEIPAAAAPAAIVQAVRPDTAPLSWHRFGEIPAAAEPPNGPVSTGPRYEVGRGK
jgi:hypothetical protein